MADVANITFKADTSQVKTAATDLDKLAKSGGYVVKAQDQTAKANAALARSMSPLISGYQQFIAANEKLRAQQEGISEGAKKTGASFKLMKGATQQISYQLQDMAVQAQMGTSAFVILGQQGPQIASVFGPGGAVFGSIIAISAAIAGTLVGAMDAAEKESDELQSTISELADKFNELTLAQQDLVSVDARSRMSDLKIEVRDLTDEYERLSSKMSLINFSDKEMAEMVKTLTILSGKISLKSEELDGLQATLDGTRGSVADMVSALEDEAAVLGKTARQKALYEAVQKKATAEQIKQINALYDSIEAYESEKTAIKSRSDAAKQAQREIDNQRKVTENLIQTLKRSNDTFGMSRAEIIRYNAAVAASEAPSEALGLSILAEAEALAEKTENLEKATIAQKAMDEAAAESERVADKMQREYERAFESMSDRITDVIMDFKSMGSVATSIAKQIARSFLQNQIVNPILGGLGFAGAPVSAASSGLNLLSSGGSLLNIGGGLATAAQGLSFFTAGGASAQQAAMLAAQTGGDAAFGSLTMESLGASGGAGGFASMIPSAGLAAIGGLILSDLLEGSKPSLTFGQGAAGAESIPFTVTQSDKGWGVAGDMATYEQISRDYNETLAKYVDTAFGRFGVLDNSFSKKVDQSLADSLLQYVSGLDEIIAGMMSEADIQSVSLTSRFVPEDVYAGMFDKPGTTPVDQLVNRYTQILEGVFPESLTSALMGGENPLDSLASGINAVNIASTFLDKSLTDIGLIFEANAREGETLADTLGRVVTNVSAAQNEFMSFAYETLGAISNLSGLSESIRDRLLTDEELYGKLETQAESIAQTIETMTDPQSITAAINQINAIVNRQAGLLDDTQFAAMGEEMAVFLDNVEAAALARTQELVDAKNAELLSMENLTSSSENISVAAVTFGDHVSRFGEMVAAMQSLLGTLSTGREIVSVN